MTDNDGSPDVIERLMARLDHLERVLQSNTQRLHMLERRLGLHAPTTSQQPEQRRPWYEQIVDERDELQPPPLDVDSTPSQPSDSFRVETKLETEVPPTPSPDEADAASEAAGERTSPPPFGAPPFESPPFETSQPAASAAPKRDFESVVGGSWFNWIGIIAFAFGVAFFLKYAFDNDWIGPHLRVTLGAVVGIGILALSERLRARGYRQYAYVLAGGGILILYLSVYAAFGFYQLISQTLAFLLMAAVTTLAVLLSVRHDALPIALLGLIGGFLTPLLLSTGRDNQVALFSYIALLDAGVLALAYFKRWRTLDLLSFLLTVAMFTGWYDRHYEIAKLWPTLFFLTVFFLMFSALAPAHNVLPQRKTRWLDILILIANATLYFGVSYSLLDEAGYVRGLGSFALLISTFYALMFYTAWYRCRSDRLLVYSYAGAAVTFFTMAIAIQTDQHWVTIGWAVEGLALTWVGIRSEESAPRHAALVVFAVAMAHWFAWDLYDFAFRESGELFVPLLNRRALSCLFLIGGILGSVWFYRRAHSVEEGERSLISTFLLTTSAALAFTLLSLDVNDYFRQRLSFLPPDQDQRRIWIENARHFSLTCLWAFYATALILVGLARRMPILRAIGLLLMGAVAIKIVILDSWFYDSVWHIPFLNPTFLAYALFAGALATTARFYSRAGAEVAPEREMATALALLAGLFAVGGTSLEAVGWFDRAAAKLVPASNDSTVAERLECGKAFALTLVWIAYSVAGNRWGIVRSSRPFRYAALFLVMLTVLKLISWDIAYYNAPWRLPIFNLTLASFTATIVGLWLIYRSYRNSPEIHEEELYVASTITVLANVLAVVALSAEALGYFAVRPRDVLDGDRMRDLALAQQLSLSLVWAVYGGGLLLFGYIKSRRLLRVMGLILLSLTTVKVFLIDLGSLDRIYRIISFIVLGAILLAVSYLYQKKQSQNRLR